MQGIGAAVLVPCSLTLLHHAYPDAMARGRAIGLWAACASIALSAGPLIGGVLVQALDWRAIFYINAPLGLLGVLLTVRYAAETPRTPHRLDLPGQVLAIITLAGLAGALIGGGRSGFVNPLVVCGFAVAILGGLVFGWVEARSREPMLPLGLFRSRTFTSTLLIGLMINIAFYGLIFVLSLYFQCVRGYSVLATGAAFAPTTAGVFAGNLLAGRFVRKVGPRLVLTTSASLTTVSLAGLLAIGSSADFVTMLGPLISLGFGLGVLVPSMTSSLLGSVETTRAGTAPGTLNTARQSGSVIGVALFGALANGDLANGLRLSLILSIALALLTVAGSAGVGPLSDG